MSRLWRTDYGFHWDNDLGDVAEVEARSSFAPRKGQHCRVVGVKTGRDNVDLYISKTGKIRVFRNGKGELK